MSRAIAITDVEGQRYRIDDYQELDRDIRDAMRDLLPKRVLRMQSRGRLRRIKRRSE